MIPGGGFHTGEGETAALVLAVPVPSPRPPVPHLGVAVVQDTIRTPPTSSYVMKKAVNYSITLAYICYLSIAIVGCDTAPLHAEAAWAAEWGRPDPASLHCRRLDHPLHTSSIRTLPRRMPSRVQPARSPPITTLLRAVPTPGPAGTWHSETTSRAPSSRSPTSAQVRRGWARACGESGRGRAPAAQWSGIPLTRGAGSWDTCRRGASAGTAQSGPSA